MSLASFCFFFFVFYCQILSLSHCQEVVPPTPSQHTSPWPLDGRTAGRSYFTPHAGIGDFSRDWIFQLHQTNDKSLVGDVVVDFEGNLFFGTSSTLYAVAPSGDVIHEGKWTSWLGFPFESYVISHSNTEPLKLFAMSQGIPVLVSLNVTPDGFVEDDKVTLPKLERNDGPVSTDVFMGENNVYALLRYQDDDKVTHLFVVNAVDAHHLHRIQWTFSIASEAQSAVLSPEANGSIVLCLEDGRFYKLNAESGTSEPVVDVGSLLAVKLNLDKELRDSLRFHGSLVLDSGKRIVFCFSGPADSGTATSGVFGFDSESGHIEWVFEPSTPLDGHLRVAAAESREHELVISDKSHVWVYDSKSAAVTSTFVSSTGLSISSPPAVHSDGFQILTTINKHLNVSHLLVLQAGDVLTNITLPAVSWGHHVVVADNVAYTPSFDVLMAHSLPIPSLAKAPPPQSMIPAPSTVVLPTLSDNSSTVVAAVFGSLGGLAVVSLAIWGASFLIRRSLKYRRRYRRFNQEMVVPDHVIPVDTFPVYQIDDDDEDDNAAPAPTAAASTATVGEEAKKVEEAVPMDAFVIE